MTKREGAIIKFAEKLAFINEIAVPESRHSLPADTKFEEPRLICCRCGKGKNWDRLCDFVKESCTGESAINSAAKAKPCAGDRGINTAAKAKPKAGDRGINTAAKAKPKAVPSSGSARRAVAKRVSK
jgi:hypothetical protein